MSWYNRLEIRIVLNVSFCLLVLLTRKDTYPVEGVDIDQLSFRPNITKGTTHLADEFKEQLKNLQCHLHKF